MPNNRKRTKPDRWPRYIQLAKERLGLFENTPYMPWLKARLDTALDQMVGWNAVKRKIAEDCIFQLACYPAPVIQRRLEKLKQMDAGSRPYDGVIPLGSQVILLGSDRPELMGSAGRLFNDPILNHMFVELDYGYSAKEVSANRYLQAGEYVVLAGDATSGRHELYQQLGTRMLNLQGAFVWVHNCRNIELAGTGNIIIEDSDTVKLYLGHRGSSIVFAANVDNLTVYGHHGQYKVFLLNGTRASVFGIDKNIALLDATIENTQPIAA